MTKAYEYEYLERLRGGSATDDDDNMEDDAVVLTQQVPEPSQPIHPVKESERNNLEQLQNKNKVVSNLSRVLLFKALTGDPIDRLKAVKEVTGDSPDNRRIASALVAAAGQNLTNVFGFQLRRIPKYMEGSLPKKYADRFFVINGVVEDESGAHSKAIHAVHADSCIEHGFLMSVLAYTFCKGSLRTDGSRWITDVDLYSLLHGQDENLPDAPRAQRKTSTQLSSMPLVSSGTPNVDVMLEKFVHMDYLLKERQQEPEAAVPTTQQTQDEEVYLYSMGPRAAMEVGRRQIVCFCAEILGEQPDPSMLEEIQQDEEEEEQEMEVN